MASEQRRNDHTSEENRNDGLNHQKDNFGYSKIKTNSSTSEMPLKYDANNDLAWLLFRPWIWIPRLFLIIISLLSLSISFIINGSSKAKETQVALAKKLLNTLTELGPCFIKLGQALSTRPDLVKKEWLEELTNLQDNLPPFSHEISLNIIEEEFGKKATELFKIFPEKPIAAASLGQVYKACLDNDNWVAVKIQRPNLPYILRRDIVIIKTLSTLLSPFLPLNLGFGLGEIVDEFGKSLFEEIDYEKEANNAIRFANLFKDNPAVNIPKVEIKLTSTKVITTSWINGTKLQNPEELKGLGYNPSSIIRTGVISGIQQLLEFGYFHADPHPGNMFALKGNSGKLGHLAYVDFGMMDSISDLDRLTLTGAVVNLINQDFSALGKDFQSLGFLSSTKDITNIIPVLKEALGGALGEEVSSFNFKTITDKFSELMFDYPFRVPARFALIIRAVVSQEGLALRLDPNFKIIGVAYPYVAKRLLAGDTKEMLEILMNVIFNHKGNLRLDRVESLLKVIAQDTQNTSSELIPVASAGIKLLMSPQGATLRNNLLLTLIKDERLNMKDITGLLKLLFKTFSVKKMANGIINNLKPITT